MGMSEKILNNNWQIVRIGNEKYFTLIMGQSPPSRTYNIEKNGLPFFQGKAEFGDFYPTQKKYCTEPSRIAEIDDVLISVRAPVGPTNMANCKCSIGRGLAAIRCSEKVFPKFLLYALRSIERNIAESVQGQGGGFTSIKKEQLKEIKIPIPPIEEQRRIVSRIEKLTSRVEKAKQLRAKAIEEAEKINHSFFNTYFSNNCKSYLFNKAVNRVRSTGGKLKTKQFEAKGHLPIVDQGHKLVAGYTDKTNYSFQGPYPVIVFGDHTRNVKYIDFPFAVGADGVVLLKPKDSGELYPKYFYYWLKNVPIYNLGYSRHYKLLKELKIPIPAVKVQRRISKQLDNVYQKTVAIDKLQQQVDEELSIFTPSLLAKAFRGDL